MGKKHGSVIIKNQKSATS